jgi:U3 small nucleolar RNA-associated protein 4
MHPSVLLLAFADNTVQIYDVETRQFPIWGKDLGTSLPKRFTHAHDPVLGVSFDPVVGTSEEGKTRYVLFWGATWLFKVTLDTRVLTGGGGKKRRREAAAAAEDAEERQWRDYKMVTQYRPILCCGFLDKDELVVVERPLVDVLLTLPPAYFKHKYGAS